MTTHLHEFNLGDGWFGNIEYQVDAGTFGKLTVTGTMFVTSEYSDGVSWVEEIEPVVTTSASLPKVIEWLEAHIRKNNT